MAAKLFILDPAFQLEPWTTGAPTAPGQVSGVTAVPSNGQVALAWPAPAANGSPITAYTIRYRLVGAGSYSVFGTTASLSIAVTGLTNGSPYEFTVEATNAAGTGVPSAAVSQIPSAGGTTFTVDDGDYHNSATHYAMPDGFTRNGAFSYVVYDVTGNGTMTIGAHDTTNYGTEVITVVKSGSRVNGFTSTQLGAGGGSVALAVTPGRYLLIEGSQARPNEAGEVTYTRLTSVVFSGGAVANKVPRPSTVPSAVVIGGDSTSVGSSLARPFWDGFTHQLQLLQTAGTVFHNLGYSSHQLWLDFQDNNATTASVARVVAAVAGATQKRYLEFGAINDAINGTGGNATAWAAARKAYHQALKAAIPDLLIQIIAPTYYGGALPYTNATKSTETALSYVTITEASNYVAAYPGADFITNEPAHLSAIGEAKLAQGAYNEENGIFPSPFNFGNSEFTQPAGTNSNLTWVAAVAGGAPDYAAPGGTATISGGVATVDQTNWFYQTPTLTPGNNYRLSLSLVSISAGAAVQVVGTGGQGQLNEFVTGAGTGRTAGVYTQDFTASTGRTSFILNVAGTGTAVVDYVRIEQIPQSISHASLSPAAPARPHRLPPIQRSPHAFSSHLYHEGPQSG